MTLLERMLYRLRMLRLALTLKPILGADDGGEEEGKKGEAETEEETSEEEETEEEEESVPKSEAAKLSRRLAEAEKKARKAERELKKAEEKKAEDEGKWKELAEERQREADEANKKLAKAERKAVIEKVAKRLKFADPDDAVRNLDAEVDAEDEAAIERELKQVLEAKPHLRSEEGSGGAPVRTRRRSGGKKTDMDALFRGKKG